MVRRLLLPCITVAATLAVMIGILIGIGGFRRTADQRWCDRAILGGAVLGVPQLVSEDLFAQQRAACAVQRERQRLFFGALWRKGGTVTADCGFQLARLQLLSQYPDARRGILEPYALDDPGFSGGDRSQQDRFMRACLAHRRRQAG